VIVYTTILGSHRDRLRAIVAPADPQGRPVRYICFTDVLGPQEAYGWELRSPLWKHPNPRRASRWHSINAHLALGDGIPHSLWQDASLQLETNPWELVDRYLTDARELATFRHPERSCIYQELETCLRLRLDDAAVMRKQVDRYREEGYPPGRGLFEASALLRTHTPRVRQFNEMWWREVAFGSVRCQLSVNYVAWKLNLPFAYLSGSRICSPYFKFYLHQSAT
jgi:Protein of unknown function (DUF616)